MKFFVKKNTFRKKYLPVFLSFAVVLAVFHACLGMQGHQPALFREPGVKVNSVKLHGQDLLTFERNGKPDRVFAVSVGDGGLGLRVLTATGVTWFDSSGKKLREILFAKTKDHFPIIAANLIPGQTHFLGFHHLENALSVYDAAGRFLFQVPASGGSGFPMAALEEGRGILVKDGRGKGVHLYDHGGTYLRNILSGGYLTSFRTLPRPELNREDLIFYNYPHGKKRGYFQIASLDGTLLDGWECKPGWSGFNFMTFEGQTAIVGNPEQAFVCVDLKGKTVAEFDAPHADYFRYVYATPLTEEYRVFLASGSGYRPYHMICVYDAGKNLIYQEINHGHARALRVPDSSRPEFFVAVENRIRRYALTP